MITSSGGGPSFIALPPKRLKPKSPLSPTASPKMTALRSSLLSTQFSTSDVTSDAARQIEYFLNSNPRTNITYSPTGAPSLTGIGEDEWSKGFAEGHEFLSSFCSEEAQPPTPEQPKGSVDLIREEGVHSFYTPGSSGSSTNTVRLSVDESRPPTAPASSKPTTSAAKRFLMRARPPSYPGGKMSSSPLRRDSLEALGSPSSSLNSSPGPHDQGSLYRSDSGKASSSPDASIRDVFVAVVGTSGVGKSTFIRRAYDLKESPKKGEHAALNVTVDGIKCNVKLVEVNSSHIDFKQHPPAWPRLHDVPFIDGVCVLYDVTDPPSFGKVPEMLDAFSRASLPVCLVSTKCDSWNRKLNPRSIDKGGGYEQIQTSIAARDSQKQSVATVLGLISRKNENQRPANGRRRANSSAFDNQATSPRPVTAGHNRASSEFSTAFRRDSDTNSIHRNPRPPATALGTLALNSSNIPPTPAASKHDTPRKSIYPGLSAPYLEVVTHAPFTMAPTLGGSSQTSLPLHGSSDPRRESYISTDEDSLSYRDSDEIPILDRESEGSILGEEKQVVKGWTFDELVDRLLAPQVTKADRDFAVTFLLVFRRFATPNELLSALIDRYEAIETEESEHLNILEAQLRHGQILHQWVTAHPGDCAAPATRKRLVAFLTRMGRKRDLAFLANEMFDVINVNPIAEDQELDWARPEPDGDNTPTMSKPQPQIPPERRTARSLQIPRSVADPRKRTSGLSYDSISSSSSSQGYVASRVPELTYPGKSSASMYDTFMSLTPQEIAEELTRIDWADFSKITAREVIRHQSLPMEVRLKARNLEHMNNIIKRFNHIAFWVGTVVLERPKAKHRARALERFMEVAWALRHMNNYNSLAAIIAGINGTAVHRLTLTRDLVDPEIRKNFMRMELLMGTHKGHTKYRLAWENTRTERIPSIPVIRRDLVSADEGNKTFLEDGRINWNKFQVMGEIVQNISQAQQKPHRVVPACPAVGKMIQEAALRADEDELYERSVKLESSNTPATGRSRRNWFARQQ